MTTKTNKNLNNPNNQNLGILPIWDLSDLYDSIESKKIGSDLEFIEIDRKVLSGDLVEEIFAVKITEEQYNKMKKRIHKISLRGICPQPLTITFLPSNLEASIESILSENFF